MHWIEFARRKSSRRGMTTFGSWPPWRSRRPMADLFAPGDKITFRDKEACARRELSFRQRVFARRVAEGKMKQADADREIELMQAILEDYVKASALEMSGRDRLR